MNLLQLQYFCSVARTLNITRAAEINHIPQPAMSRQITNLEKELNVQLFIREHNRLVLTKEGKLFYDRVNSALNSLDDGLNMLAKTNEELSGVVNVVANQQRKQIVECAIQFQKMHPEVIFNISPSEKQFDDDYDIYINQLGTFDTSFPFQRLYSEPLAVAVSKDHPLANKNTVRLKDLINENFIFTSPSSGILKVTEEHFKAMGAHIKITAYIDDMYCEKLYIQGGLAITTFPYLTWHDFYEPEVKTLLVDEPTFARTSMVAKNPKKKLSHAAEAFYDSICAHFDSFLTKSE